MEKMPKSTIDTCANSGHTVFMLACTSFNEFLHAKFCGPATPAPEATSAVDASVDPLLGSGFEDEQPEPDFDERI
jgi:hypothetical protein